MRKYYHDYNTDPDNVMSIELRDTNHFVTIEISDSDGDHEPKSIRMHKQAAARLANDLKLISELM